MLFSRAGVYPKGQTILYGESFSPNTVEGACPHCHGIGQVFDITEKIMVPDDSLSIRQRAIASWPSAWQGQNLRDILVTLGYDVDKPWYQLPKKDRDWILFTDEQPTVPVYAGFTPAETRRALKKKMEPSYQGTFTSARKYILDTFSKTQSALMKRRVSAFMIPSLCPVCKGKKLRRESLSVTFAGIDIAEMSGLPLKELKEKLGPFINEKNEVVHRIVKDLSCRLEVLLKLGLGYLSLDRSTPTLSPGELQRLRLGTQVYSNLFGVIYVLDEPSAGLHPADTEALLSALDQLKRSGNSIFVVEHDLDIIKKADWIVDVGPSAGSGGGEILYSGPADGLREIANSKTAGYLFRTISPHLHVLRKPAGWLSLKGIHLHNLHNLSADFPLGVLTTVTGISGSGKSSLVSRSLIDLVTAFFGEHIKEEVHSLEEEKRSRATGHITGGMENIRRLVQVDQKPIGRTPRSNLATYTGLFDSVRQIFASTKSAKSRKYDAGQFSFNVPKGRCETCEGEGFVMVELLFLPSVYSPCPTCKGSRYNSRTLEITYQGRNISEVLSMTVDEAFDFFSGVPAVQRSLAVLREVGLGYIRLGQPATELSGGEAQRIKLATELQSIQHGRTLYILDEPTTGLHPSDVEKLIVQLNRLVNAGNTVIVVEHDMQVIAASDWVIDMGPGAGNEGGKIVASGIPSDLAKAGKGRTGSYLLSYFEKKG
jgi:excinuclease ABC subunit A